MLTLPRWWGRNVSITGIVHVCSNRCSPHAHTCIHMSFRSRRVSRKAEHLLRAPPPPLPFAAEDRCFTSPPTRTSRRRGNKRAGRNRPTGYATRVKLRARKCRMQITSKCVTCSTQHGAHIAYRTSNHKGRQKQVLFCNSDILSHTSARARMHTCLLA